MHKTRQILYIVLIICVFLTSQSYAIEKIKIATLNWEPYIGQTLTNEGFMAEITREAFKKVGYKVEYTYLPWKRAVIMAENGKFDGYFPAYWSEQREEKSIFTDVIISGPVVFLKMKDSNISYKSLMDLKAYRIGVVRGFVNTKKFDNATYLNKEAVTTNLQNIKKLTSKRLDLIVIDKFVGFYLIDKYVPHMSKQVVSLHPPLENNKLYICMSKKSNNIDEKLRAFNKGLQEIKENGSFNKILKKHGF